MSYSFSPTSSGVSLDRSDRCLVPAQAVQSAISTHQHKSARIDKVAHGDKLYMDSQIEFEAASAAYFSGKISGAEFDAALKRVMDIGRDYRRRAAVYDARNEAGLIEPGDFYKEFYGCTDEEAQECLRHDRTLADIQRANEARNGSRMLQQSRSGRAC